MSLAPVVGGNLFSLAFGRNLDAHDPPEAADLTATNATLPFSLSPPPTDIPIPTMRALPLPSTHQCLDGRECYIASVYVTLGACVVGLGLAVWAGWRDWRHRKAVGAVLEEVMWENEGEFAGAEN